MAPAGRAISSARFAQRLGLGVRLSQLKHAAYLNLNEAWRKTLRSLTPNSRRFESRERSSKRSKRRPRTETSIVVLTPGAVAAGVNRVGGLESQGCQEWRRLGGCATKGRYGEWYTYAYKSRSPVTPPNFYRNI